MKKPFQNCDPLMVNRFYDQELDPVDYDRIDQHIHACASCRKTLADLKTVSGSVKRHITEACDIRYESCAETILETIGRKRVPWGEWIKETFFSKRMLIPATAVASMVIIFFILFRPSVSAEPSAIVASLSGDISSVIIMETPQTRQTILWFNENVSQKE